MPSSNKKNKHDLNKDEISLPVDVSRFNEMGLLNSLLLDQTTGKNIIWATNAYKSLGQSFDEKSEITSRIVTGEHANVIRRRARKDKEEQTALTRAHAEVFTPAWIVKMMIDAADEAWREGLKQPDGKEEWQAYVESPRLEITCGEAPFLVNRYDAADGMATPLQKRMGILSRKLALVNEHTKTREEWMQWAKIAVQSIYGYEFQGDNLLIARVNVLCTLEDYLIASGFEEFKPEEYVELANTISWNLWQMDGLTKCVPFGTPEKDKAEASFFDLEDGSLPEKEAKEECVIYDWKHDKQIEFASIRKGNDMKFDYVIGNPPYQEEQEGDNKNYAPPIYDKFMDGAYKVADKVELITPARFLFDAGSTPKAWNKKMLSDPHLKVLYYEADSSKVFPTTDIKGGVSVTYRDETKDFGAIETFVSFEELRSIMKKTSEKGEPSFKDIIYASESYRFTDKMHEDLPNAEALLSKGHKYDLKTSVLKALEGVAFFDAPKADGEYIKIIGLVEQKRAEKWIKRDYIKGPNNFDAFKVILPAANGSGAIGEVLSTPLIGAPLIGHTQTFISIGSFETEEEAKACLKYVKSKFARTLLGVLKITQHNPGPKWKYVPMQDFTSSSDIDWSQSVSEIDVQLYEKYGLTDDEIKFIEEHVKAMD